MKASNLLKWTFVIQTTQYIRFRFSTFWIEKLLFFLNPQIATALQQFRKFHQCSKYFWRSSNRFRKSQFALS
jgi:hypothetical protein